MVGCWCLFLWSEAGCVHLPVSRLSDACGTWCRGLGETAGEGWLEVFSVCGKPEKVGFGDREGTGRISTSIC